MLKYALCLFIALVLFLGIKGAFDYTQSAPLSILPPELTITSFAGADVTPSPACLAVAPTGEVFVGVDMMGSLGKKPGYGRIIKLIDRNNDGKADEHIAFAAVNNPRGIIASGNQVFVLHSTFSKQSGRAT